MKDKLGKLYEHFLPIERVNLFLAALARDDIEETRKLKATCPKKRYIIQDLTFLNFSFGLERVINYFLLNHQRAISNITLFTLAKSVANDLVCECEEALEAILEKGGQSIDKTYIEQKEQHLSSAIDVQGQLYERQNKEVVYLKSLHAGLRLFCAEVGLDYQNALDLLAQNVTGGFFEFQCEEFIEVQEDVDLSESIKKDFLGFWN